MDKPLVLVSVARYLPGYRAGGPLRSVSNLVASLRDEFDFHIVTNDRDAGDVDSYKGVAINEWNGRDGAQVMYAAPGFLTLRRWRALLTERPYQAVYLNSFFCPQFSVWPLIASRSIGSPAPVLVAPRGEFSAGALAIRATKKRLFIQLAKRTGLYDGVEWHASSQFERAELLRVWPQAEHCVHVAANMSSAEAALGSQPVWSAPVGRELRLLYVSRITPKKNLLTALRALEGISTDVQFTIVGHCDDEAYWRQCRDHVARLPSNVRIEMRGALPHAEVQKLWAEHEMLVLPTFGENFGHVILEALAAGCPVLTTPYTAFRGLDAAEAGWEREPTEVEQWRTVIQGVASSGSEERKRRRVGARQFAEAFIEQAGALSHSRRMLYEVLGERFRTRSSGAAA